MHKILEMHAREIQQAFHNCRVLLRIYSDTRIQRGVLPVSTFFSASWNNLFLSSSNSNHSES